MYNIIVVVQSNPPPCVEVSSCSSLHGSECTQCNLSCFPCIVSFSLCFLFHYGGPYAWLPLHPLLQLLLTSHWVTSPSLAWDIATVRTIWMKMVLLPLLLRHLLPLSTRSLNWHLISKLQLVMHLQTQTQTRWKEHTRVEASKPRLKRAYPSWN